MLKLFFLLVFVSGIVAGHYFNQRHQTEVVPVIYPDCQLDKQACMVSLNDFLNLTIELAPFGLPALETLELRITGEGIRSRSDMFKAWFEGEDMDMGRHYFLPVDQAGKSLDGVLLKGMIPVCTLQDAMGWYLFIEFNHENSSYLLRFELQSHQRILD